MKLEILAPRWVVGSFRLAGRTVMPSIDGVERHGMGISFLCPVHTDHRLAVFFTNPVDGGPAVEGKHYLWRRTGETFDTLTLGPSIDASKHKHGHEVKTPCWHGFVQDGEIR